MVELKLRAYPTWRSIWSGGIPLCPCGQQMMPNADANFHFSVHFVIALSHFGLKFISYLGLKRAHVKGHELVCALACAFPPLPCMRAMLSWSCSRRRSCSSARAPIQLEATRTRGAPARPGLASPSLCAPMP